MAVGFRSEDLFTAGTAGTPPLAERMRPRTLDEFVGQEHILGPGRLLRRAIQADRITSVIFSGPPGTGKTTLARIIANTTQAQFLAINAVLAGVKDIRAALDSALEARRLHGRGTLLFVDEVHRFNKAQQDALLPHVENGTLILIGATTENPYFEVNKALVSRSRIFQLRALEDADVRRAVDNALRDADRGYGKLRVQAEPGALEHLVRMAQGDARSALNALELAVETTAPDAGGARHITLAVAEESIQRKAVLYDKDGDAHYDTISAFIKAVRGSDPDAALYWLAKMVEAGEDPRFLFRRMVILAAEDVGLADPRALAVVMSAAAAFDYVGLPEGQFHLAEACLYLATAPKSNSALAYFDALETVRRERIGEVPDALKDKSRDADLGHGQGYLYPHAFRDHWVAQQYLPAGLRGRAFYEPGRLGYESGVRAEVLRRREAQWAVPPNSPGAVAAREGDWLRTAETGSEALRRLRDDLCEAAALRRESLVLDLGGHHGFLAWEALRRCLEGGVWCRCESEAEQAEFAAWAQRLDAMGQPQAWVCSLPGLAEPGAFGSEAPNFDALLGLQITPPSWEWVEALHRTVARRAVWVLAWRREAEWPWNEWLSQAPQAMRVKALSLATPAALGPGQRLAREWEAQAGWNVRRLEKTYAERRRLTPTQVRAGLDRAAHSGAFAALRAALEAAEWETLCAHVGEYLSAAPRDFTTAYDVIVARPQ